MIAIKGLEGAKRCPDGHEAPEVIVDEKDLCLTLQCAQHGHIGPAGSTMEKAVEYWNKYISFIEKERAS